jgi:methionyl-tRNA formyltransferase
MDRGLDTGPMLSQRSIPIAPDDTRQSLTERLAELGASLLQETLPDWLNGTIQAQAQDDSLATLAPPIKKEQGRIQWDEPAELIARKVRAFYPWPGTFTLWQEKPLKILSAIPHPQPEDDEQLSVGTVVQVRDEVEIITGQGKLRLIQVQPAGKRPMSARDFARGARNFVGSRLE